MARQNYSRSNISIDINQLPENADAVQSSQYATLTEGAIGYRKFTVIEGEKVLAVITRAADHSFPPFGASVYNKNNIEVGMISDDGFVYLSGVKAGETLGIKWENGMCKFQLPETLENNLSNTLLLLCK